MRIVLEPQGLVPKICPRCSGWGTVLVEKRYGKDTSVVEQVCPRCLGERVLFEPSSRKDVKTLGFLKSEMVSNL